MDEFELIDCFRRALGPQSATGIELGSGDDAAVLMPPAGHQVVVSVDTAVEGRHFPVGSAPELIGWRSLAMNLSDIAAMGARPWCAFLAITARDLDALWVRGFAEGWRALADSHRVAVAGGNLTQGELAVSVTVMGLCARGAALVRGGAKVGDDLWVSGELGLASAGLADASQCRSLGQAREAGAALRRYWLPEPRIELGAQLVGLASAAIDVSDGLLQDIGHLLESSGVGADLQSSELPCAGRDWRAAAIAGDDYELCFTAPPECRARIDALSPGCSLSRIGEISAAPGLRVDGKPEVPAGYRHF